MLLPALGAVAVGVLVALQARINADLAERLAAAGAVPADRAAAVQAAAISFGTGLALALLVVGLSPGPRAALRRLAGELVARRLQARYLVGGLAGAWLVATQGLAVPLIGVAVYLVAVVAGQGVGSLVVDAVGLGHGPRRPATGRRVLAAALGVAAVGAAVLGPGGADLGPADTLPLLLAVLAGLGVSAQQAVNGRVAVAAGSPMPAAVVNFCAGSLALGVGLVAGLALGHWQPAAPPAGPLWLYLGGPIGVCFISMAAVLVPRVGVLHFAVAAICGQLLGGVLLDVVWPTRAAAVGPGLAAGVALCVTAVLLSATGGYSPRGRMLR